MIYEKGTGILTIIIKDTVKIRVKYCNRYLNIGQFGNNRFI